MRIIEETLRTPVAKACDVLIAGGGIAGISAALAAARAGAKALLIEREYLLGGLATAGLVTIYLPLCDGMGHQVSFGISEELLRLSIRDGAEARYPALWLEGGSQAERAQGPRFEVQYNPHLFAIAAEELLLREGVEILYGASICGAHRDGKRIDCVIVENKSGRFGIEAKSVVDATGDADICHLAGARTALYSPGNILAAWYYALEKGELLLRIHGAAETPDEERTGNEPPPLVPERFSGIDGDELSRMMRLAHGAQLRDIYARREQDPTYVPVTLPSIPQVRMTRRLAGCYTLDDAQGRPAFADSIGRIGNWRKRGPSYDIPLRALYGPDVSNLIAAGRCISVTDAMWDLTRAIPACAVTGEAAGVAAAMTDDFASLDVRLLQERLALTGARREQ